MIALVLMLCAFSVGTSEFVIVGVLPEVAADLSVSLPVAGMLVTAYAVAVALGGPVLTVLTGRLPRRPLLIAVMALGTVAAVLSALAADYTLLMGARMLAALAQGLFLSVASQVAIASVPPERQTAAVAKVVNGIALSTVLGVPVGTLVGQAYGWRASFVLVTALTVIGLIGVLVACPRVAHEPEPSVRESMFAFAKPTVLLGLLTTVLTFTGMITAFTYVTPTLREVTGLSPGWVTAILLVYGLGTVVGSNLAGRVQPAAIPRVLPIPIAVLTVLLVAQGFLMHNAVTAVLALFLLGASAFATGPLLHTWLMGQAGRAAGLVASVNISAFNVAAAFGPLLGGAVIGGGLGLDLVPGVAAAPALAGAAVALVISSLVRSSRPARHRAPAAIGSPGSP
ncbi:MFS transporter [Allokutzneria albata]|uniref:MFS transporter, DHA1 family, arabinose polymer transporter n=1 Tax=Allokutzneria albata TaxID=211114 RepID=A0A1G9WHC0_ALLAB|nr:MFS transporter [Allokutzneria albata]SDM83962.1 MFS transporter, DHA1 family, arabinose polymer transporter [Allokutzneria albata]